MYENFFGVNSHPFDVNPNPEFLVLTEHTLETLECLWYGIRQHKGFVQLTGEVGTGKTLLLNALLRRLNRESSCQSAFIFNSRLNAEDFLEFVMAEFGIAHASNRKSDMLRQLNQWLLERFASGETAVLMVDEAQNLSTDVLEEVRLLTNLETPTHKLLQIVLAGQPELETKLKDPSLRQLRQRIMLHCKTQPLTYEETVAYIERRLKIAGCQNPGTFSAGALRVVFEYSRGIPRVINGLCEQALIEAYAADERPILLRTVEAVAREFDLELPQPPIAAASDRGQGDAPCDAAATAIIPGAPR